MAENISMEELRRYINVEEGLERVMNNKALYNKLLRSFKNNDCWEQLQNQMDTRDYESAARTTHAIKGMVSNLSFTALFDVSLQLETQLKGNSYEDETYVSMKEAMEKTLACIDILLASAE